MNYCIVSRCRLRVPGSRFRVAFPNFCLLPSLFCLLLLTTHVFFFFFFFFVIWNLLFQIWDFPIWDFPIWNFHPRRSEQHRGIEGDCYPGVSRSPLSIALPRATNIPPRWGDGFPVSSSRFRVSYRRVVVFSFGFHQASSKRKAPLGVWGKKSFEFQVPDSLPSIVNQ